jgi:hypothetical protein
MWDQSISLKVLRLHFVISQEKMKTRIETLWRGPDDYLVSSIPKTIKPLAARKNWDKMDLQMHLKL